MYKNDDFSITKWIFRIFLDRSLYLSNCPCLNPIIIMNRQLFDMYQDFLQNWLLNQKELKIDIRISVSLISPASISNLSIILLKYTIASVRKYKI